MNVPLNSDEVIGARKLLDTNIESALRLDKVRTVDKFMSSQKKPVRGKITLVIDSGVDVDALTKQVPGSKPIVFDPDNEVNPNGQESVFFCDSSKKLETASHGTHVAGISLQVQAGKNIVIARAGHDLRNVESILSTVKTKMDTDEVIEGSNGELTWRDIGVINCSFGWGETIPDFSETATRIFRDCVKAIIRKGCVFVKALGNESCNLSTPKGSQYAKDLLDFYEEMRQGGINPANFILVEAAEKNGKTLASYSNESYGLLDQYTVRTLGVVKSTVPASVSKGRMCVKQGTSMASPIVSAFITDTANRYGISVEEAAKLVMSSRDGKVLDGASVTAKAFEVYGSKIRLTKRANFIEAVKGKDLKKIDELLQEAKLYNVACVFSKLGDSSFFDDSLLRDALTCAPDLKVLALLEKEQALFSPVNNYFVSQKTKFISVGSQLSTDGKSFNEAKAWYAENCVAYIEATNNVSEKELRTIISEMERAGNLTSYLSYKKLSDGKYEINIIQNITQSIKLLNEDIKSVDGYLSGKKKTSDVINDIAKGFKIPGKFSFQIHSDEKKAHEILLANATELKNKKIQSVVDRIRQEIISTDIKNPKAYKKLMATIKPLKESIRKMVKDFSGCQISVSMENCNDAEKKHLFGSEINDCF